MTIIWFKIFIEFSSGSRRSCKLSEGSRYFDCQRSQHFMLAKINYESKSVSFKILFNHWNTFLKFSGRSSKKRVTSDIYWRSFQLFPILKGNKKEIWRTKFQFISWQIYFNTPRPGNININKIQIFSLALGEVLQIVWLCAAAGEENHE